MARYNARQRMRCVAASTAKIRRKLSPSVAYSSLRTLSPFSRKYCNFESSNLLYNNFVISQCLFYAVILHKEFALKRLSNFFASSAEYLWQMKFFARQVPHPIRLHTVGRSFHIFSGLALENLNIKLNSLLINVILRALPSFVGCIIQIGEKTTRFY